MLSDGAVSLSTSRHRIIADVLRHLIAPLHAGTPGNSVCIGVEIAPGNGPGANHHQGRIVVSALFSQLSNFALGIRKCSCKIRQVRTTRIIFDPVLSAYCEEISRHRTPPRLRPSGLVLHFIDDGQRSIDADQRRVSGERRSSSGSLSMLDDPPRFIAGEQSHSTHFSALWLSCSAQPRLSISPQSVARHISVAPAPSVPEGVWNGEQQ